MNFRGSIYSISLIIVLLLVLILYGRVKLGVIILNKGVVSLEQGNYDEAIRSFKTSLKINPNSFETHYALGTVYAEKKQTAQAIDEFKKTIKINPGFVKAYRGLASLYYNSQDYETALSFLASARKIAPNDKETQSLADSISYEYLTDALNKSVDAFMAGDKRRAFKLVETALAFNPRLAFAHYTLAYFYYADNQMTEAEQKLLETVGIDPAFTPAYKLLGDMYFKNGEYEKAVSTYKEALRSDTGNAYIYNDIGIVLMQMERYDESIDYFRKGLAIAPSNPQIQYSLASVYRDSGKRDDALREYSEIVSRYPDFPNIHNDMAEIYGQKGEMEAANEEYKKEILHAQNRLLNNPGDVIALNNLAFAYSGLGEYSKAQEIIEKVIQSAPNYRKAHLTFSRIFEKQGMHQQAMDELNTAKHLSVETNFIDRDISRIKNLQKKSLLESGNPPDEPFDLVWLKNGRQIEGRVISETEDAVILQVSIGNPAGQITLYKGTIQRIIKGRDRNNN
ncbi:MAG: tetratricopeptide repeat protein [Candidatus Omnitrophica bacterium]|nr:tetratricopeptide repeat protein [Candidatus Omnitrophota bacterium]